MADSENRGDTHIKCLAELHMEEFKNRGDRRDTYPKCLAWGIDYHQTDDYAFWSEYDRKSAIIESFRHHQPDDDQIRSISIVRNGCIVLAEHLMRVVPPGDDLTAALRKLHECMMTANKAIVCENRDE